MPPQNLSSFSEDTRLAIAEEAVKNKAPDEEIMKAHEVESVELYERILNSMQVHTCVCCSLHFERFEITIDRQCVICDPRGERVNDVE